MEHPFKGLGPVFLALAGYVAGVAAGLAARDAASALAALLALCALFPILFRRRGGNGTSALAMAVCGILVAGRLPFANPEDVRPYLDNETVLRATVREVRFTDAGWSADADDAVVSHPGEGKGVRLPRVLLSVRNANAAVSFPAEIRAAGRLAPIRSQGNPGEFPAGLSAMAKGVQYRFASDASKTVLLPGGGSAGPLDTFFLAARGRTSRWLLRAGGSSDGALLLRSLATGEVPPPSHPLVVLLRRTGLAHLFAISGINVAIFFLLLALALRGILGVVNLRRAATDIGRLSTFLALPACWGYVLLAGAPLPAVRSAGMITIGALLFLARGVRGAGRAWAACLFATVTLDPFAPLSPSFLLSYGATFHLIAAAGGGRPRGDDLSTKGRILRWGRDAAAASTAAFFGTLPVTCLFFRAVPAGAILWNVVFGPLLGGAGVAGAALAVVGGALSIDLLGPPVRLAVVILDFALLLLDRLSAGGWGYASVPPPGVPASLVFIAAGAAAAIRASRHGRSSATAVALSGAAFLAWVHLPYAALPRGDFLLTALNVGRGASHVAALPGGKTVVIDAGSALRGDAGRRILLPALRGMGIRRVDVLVLTHPHEDHYGGAAALLAELPVGEIWIPRGSRPADFGPAVAAASASVREKGEGDVFAGGGATIRIRAPSAGISGAPAKGGANGSCLVLEIRHAALDVWLPGDVESGPAVWGPVGPEATSVTVLFLPHHGSPGARPEDWIRAARPGLAVSHSAAQDINCSPDGNLLPSCRSVRLESGAFSVKSDGREIVWSQPGHPELLARLWRLE